MARETKHTPGKWSASQGYDNMYNQAVMEISSESTEQFVTIWSGQDYIDDTTEANARLIAAAPAMLEMLQEIADKFDKDQHLLNVSPTKIKELIKTIEG